MKVQFNTAKLAQEKGYDVFTYNIYDLTGRFCEGNPYSNNTIWIGEDVYKAPTQSELQKWLRSKGVYVEPQLVDTLTGQHQYQIFTTGNGTRNPGKIYDTYEEALEEGLQQALKLIK